MGYTQYFNKRKDPTPEQWTQITTGLRKLLEQALPWGRITGMNIPPIRWENRDPRPLMTPGKHIAFNGIGEDAHEDMMIGPEDPNELNFCKTNEKPYDLWVAALLILVHHYASDCWEIDGDGGAGGFEPALSLVRIIFPDVTNPLSA